MLLMVIKIQNDLVPTPTQQTKTDNTVLSTHILTFQYLSIKNIAIFVCYILTHVVSVGSGSVQNSKKTQAQSQRQI